MTLSPAYVLDFDGTVTTADLSNDIVRWYGGKAYRDLERRYRNREMPIREWLRRAAKLLPANLEELKERCLQQAELRPGFREFIRQAGQQSSPVVIASDGLGFYIEPILRRHNLLDQITFVYRNDLVRQGDSALVIQNPYAHPTCPICGNCKAAHVFKFKEQGRPVIYVGDGRNDRFGASWSDLICARDNLVTTCSEYGFPCLKWDDFYDIAAASPPEPGDRMARALCQPHGEGIREEVGL